MQPFEFVRFATGPKRSMGHVLGAKKGIFLIRGRGRPTVYGGRTSGILSIRGPCGLLGSPRVGTIHAQAPTPHAPPLRAFLADSLISSHQTSMNYLAMASRASGGPQESAHAAQATTHYQTYPGGRLRADLPPKKVCNLDPMAPRSRQKRQLPEGPQ